MQERTKNIFPTITLSIKSTSTIRNNLILAWKPPFKQKSFLEINIWVLNFLRWPASKIIIILRSINLWFKFSFFIEWITKSVQFIESGQILTHCSRSLRCNQDNVEGVCLEQDINAGVFIIKTVMVYTLPSSIMWEEYRHWMDGDGISWVKVLVTTRPARQRGIKNGYESTCKERAKEKQTLQSH